MCNKVYKRLYLKSHFNENDVRILIYSLPNNNEMATDNPCESLITKALGSCYSVVKNDTLYDSRELRMPQFSIGEQANSSFCLGSSVKGNQKASGGETANPCTLEGIKILLLPETKNICKETNAWYDVTVKENCCNVITLSKLKLELNGGLLDIQTEDNIKFESLESPCKDFDFTVRCDAATIKKLEKSFGVKCAD